MSFLKVKRTCVLVDLALNIWLKTWKIQIRSKLKLQLSSVMTWREKKLPKPVICLRIEKLKLSQTMTAQNIGHGPGSQEKKKRQDCIIKRFFSHEAGCAAH